MIIPLEAIPNQKFTVILEEKECEIELLSRGVNIFMNLTVDDNVVFQGVICLNGVNLLSSGYNKLSGSLYFTDTQGNLDPLYYGLGSRWVLNYV